MFCGALVDTIFKQFRRKCYFIIWDIFQSELFKKFLWEKAANIIICRFAK